MPLNCFVSCYNYFCLLEIFRKASESEFNEMNRKGLTTPTADVGITPGLINGSAEDERPVSRGREYDSEYAKLSLQGGHKSMYYVEDIIPLCSTRAQLLLIYVFTKN